jgi:hypothetical protein
MEKKIYYKGIARQTLSYLLINNFIVPKINHHINRYGCYITKSFKVASSYGDFVLILSLDVNRVVKSGHSSQLFYLGSIKRSDVADIRRIK